MTANSPAPIDAEVLHAAHHRLTISPPPKDADAFSGYACYGPKSQCLRFYRRLAAEYDRLALVERPAKKR